MLLALRYGVFDSLRYARFQWADTASILEDVSFCSSVLDAREDHSIQITLTSWLAETPSGFLHGGTLCLPSSEPTAWRQKTHFQVQVKLAFSVDQLVSLRKEITTRQRILRGAELVHSKSPAVSSAMLAYVAHDGPVCLVMACNGSPISERLAPLTHKLRYDDCVLSCPARFDQILIQRIFSP